MFKKTILLLSLFLLFSCNNKDHLASEDFYKSVHFLNQKNDDLTIKDAIKLYNEGAFNVPLENKVFFDIQNLEASWLHFKIDNHNEDLFFSIWGAFLEYGKIYLHTNDKTNALDAFSLLDSGKPNSLYRLPTWKLKQTNATTHVFLKIKDTKRVTSLKLLLNNSEQFLNFTQKDTMVITVILAFLLTMLVIILSLFIAKKQYSLLWYGAYIITFSIELLINHGIDLQISLFTSEVGHQVKRTLFQSLGSLFMLQFFTHFYPYTSSTRYIQQLFKYLVFYFVIVVLILLSFIAFDSIYFPKKYVWLPGRSVILIVLVLHFILIYKKTLPWYLGVGFTLPLLSYIRFLTTNPGQDLSLTNYFILDNFLYLSFVVEMLLIVYYIISRLVASEFLAINLKNENLQLRNSFQEGVLEVQQQERNKLLNNVHDSFGGYLEALKLRLLNKKENTPEKVQEILDAFYKEYRYLLNSLYSPKINSDNFIENLIEFCNKLNQLTGSNYIKHQFSIQDTKLSQEKCVHMYRIISELTTNAIKHSDASQITINLSQDSSNEIILVVSDNGKGFNKTKTNSNSYGLKNITKRVHRLEGKVDIKTEKNKGTMFIIKIPIVDK